MKAAFFVAALLSLFSVAPAQARDVETVLERRTTEDRCEVLIQVYASRKNLTLKAIGQSDYLLLVGDEKVGNGYWSQGICRIYMSR